MSSGPNAGLPRRAYRLFATLPAALALPGLAALPAAAQEPTDGEVPSLEIPAVVVTANRVPDQPEEVGSSVTVLEREEIQRTRPREAVDVLRRVPGLSVTQSGGLGSATVVRLRGADSGQVQVLLDGVEVNDPSSASGDFSFAGLLASGIDRIEVLRGPQSALYGSDAIGGVISLSTGVGDGDPTGSLTGEYGSFGTYRGSANVEGAFDRVAYGLTAAGVITDGFSRRDEDLGFTEEDGAAVVNVTGRIVADLLPTLSAEVSGGYLRNDADLDISSADENSSSTVLDLVYGRFALEHFAFDGDLTTTAEFTASSTDREVTDADLVSEFTGQRFEGGLRSVYALTDSVSLIGGFGVEVETGRGEDIGGTSPGERFDDALTNVSVHGLVRVEPLDDLVLTLGGRIDDFEAGGTEATYRATAVYDFPDFGTTIRGSVGTAARAPTIFQLNDSFTVDFGGFVFRTEPNPDLETETSLGVDFGVEQAFFDDRVRLSATGFYNAFDNLISFERTRFENIAEAETFGVEVAFTAQPLPWMVWQVNYTYLETEDLDTGLDLSRRPRHSMTAIVDIQPIDDLTLVGEVRYVGEQFNDSDNDDVLDAFTVVNFSAAYDVTEFLTTFVRLENAFDESYQEALGFGTADRSIFGGVTLSF